MPRFEPMPAEQAQSLERGKRASVDLQPYIDAISSVARGEWQIVTPDTDAGEDANYVRRRIQQAKRKLHLIVATKKSDDGTLLFFKVVGEAPSKTAEAESNTTPRSSRSRQSVEPEPELASV